ncbi:MAG: RlmE family RNA methyltransferase [Alphaproteobacteria bacterium]
MGATGRRGGRGGRARASSGAPAGRGPGAGIRTAKGRKGSSIRWLERQLRDPYVAEARRLGLRSRAAFKLIELDERFHLLAPGKRVVDLGAAPGGWTQVAIERVNATGKGAAKRRGRVVAVEIAEFAALEGATVVRADMLSRDGPARAKEALTGPADVVLSDMAEPATGHPGTDHLRTMALAEAAFAFAREVLAPGGAFVAKVLRGGTEKALLDALKREFGSVRHAKPPASRPESAEIYVVATGFKGGAGGKSPGKTPGPRANP